MKNAELIQQGKEEVLRKLHDATGAVIGMLKIGASLAAHRGHFDQADKLLDRADELSGEKDAKSKGT